MSDRQTHFFKLAALLLSALILQACASGPTDKTAGKQAIAEPEELRTPETSDLTLPPSVYAATFSAAGEALAQLDWMSAASALAELDQEPLSADDLAYRDYLAARIEHLRGDSRAAAARLAALDGAELNPAIAYRVHNFQRHLLDLRRDYLDSARLGVRIMAMAPTADQAALKRSIWRDLARCSADEIDAAREGATEQTWLGWLDLARVAGKQRSLLATELGQWQASYPGHPAGDPLPGGLAYSVNPAPSPAQVTLVLPLSGRLAPAGKAIRDGYLASYFAARSVGEAPEKVKVLDSDLYGSASEAYNAAVQQGAQLVIGPLRKNAVAELAAQGQRTVPTIALNRIDTATSYDGAALVQLALAPEDEARQLARLAFGNGARRALILRPAGSWGDKMETSLAQQWRQLGGSIARSITYTGQDDYSAGVKSGLGIEASEQRRRQVRDMLATNVEFTPRRRADLDAIFMLSRNPDEARAIKPLLAFHYAGALPVYATSSVYGAHYDARNRDLDNTIIVDLPWLLAARQPLRQALSEANSDHYTRLNALGADAYLLQSRLGQLRAGPDALIAGETGLLSMNPQRQMERELPAAIFDGDRLRPL
ncbi:penicillin-binding protein activator [Seongchinamella sediminis]|uniref:Penicillin-binding protein activator n=1 Tax=Seongchinamella sediminis TaxID=2283635 RepID=A0A3L7E3I0_9GAMM|nr:penicillin-binding protein activator [Seongchinamella sediminis]RLQ23719.1 penicillin-binding protein activator [Seongchinamella sediminis]